MFARRVVNQVVGRQEKMASETSAKQTSGPLREIALNAPNEVHGAKSKQMAVKRIPVTEQTKATIHRVIQKVPTGVTGVHDERTTRDAVTDLLHENLPVTLDVEMSVEPTETSDDTYPQDIHCYLQSIEHKCCPGPTFLTNGEITSSNRKVLVAWMRELQEFLKIRQETFHLALSITDLVVQSGSVELGEYQLLGLVGFLIAAKYLERYVPQIDTLMYLASYAYDYRTILSKEKQVLRILDYDLNLPTPAWFLEYYTRDEEFVKVHQLATLFLDLFAMDLESTTELPLSSRAASALMTANQLMTRPTGLWQKDLIFKSGYTTDLLQPANQKLKGLITGLHKKAEMRSGADDRGHAISLNSTTDPGRQPDMKRTI